MNIGPGEVVAVGKEIVAKRNLKLSAGDRTIVVVKQEGGKNIQEKINIYVYTFILNVYMYKVAIPSYKREKILLQKSLPTLLNGKVNAANIYIFVANLQEKRIYEEVIPKKMYNSIIVGKKGIANQRIFIRNYFNQGEYIVSIDDDIEKVLKFVNEKQLSKISNLDSFFKKAYKYLKKQNAYIWGIYPVSNPFFMRNGPAISTDLRFLIGGLHGYIVRKDKS